MLKFSAPTELIWTVALMIGSSEGIVRHDALFASMPCTIINARQKEVVTEDNDFTSIYQTLNDSPADHTSWSLILGL